ALAFLQITGLDFQGGQAASIPERHPRSAQPGVARNRSYGTHRICQLKPSPDLPSGVQQQNKEARCSEGKVSAERCPLRILADEVQARPASRARVGRLAKTVTEDGAIADGLGPDGAHQMPRALR